MTRTDTAAAAAKTYDAVVIGAGFAGLYMLYRLRQLGMTARVYESGDGVGGTPIPFRRSCSRSGSGQSATRSRPKS